MAAGRPYSSPGFLLELIRRKQANTRADLCGLTGLARSTVADRLDLLIERGLIHGAGQEPSTGGRRPATFALNEDFGVVLAADVGATHTRLAVTNLGAKPLAERAENFEVAGDPKRFVQWITGHWSDLLREGGRSRRDVLGVGVGLPAPVDFYSGKPYRPPIMPGWDEFPLGAVLSEAFGVPTLIDNDVNLMALGEHWTHWHSASHLLFVKIGTGIGSGIVSEGEIYRGSDGSAGDIGHVQVAGAEEVPCLCGNTGCLEAVAGGGAMVRQLGEQGIHAHDARAVVDLVKNGNGAAVQLVRRAGRLIGEGLAGAINVLNPGVLVLGGDVAHADEQLLPGVREAVYARSTPLATRNLRIVRSALDDRAGVVGAAVVIIEHVLSPEAIDAQLADGRSRFARNATTDASGSVSS